MNAVQLYNILKDFNRSAKIYMNINGDRYELGLTVSELMGMLASAPAGYIPSESRYHSEVTGVWSWSLFEGEDLGDRDIDKEKKLTPYVVLQTNLSLDRKDIESRPRRSDLPIDCPIGCPAVVAG